MEGAAEVGKSLKIMMALDPINPGLVSKLSAFGTHAVQPRNTAGRKKKNTQATWGSKLPIPSREGRNDP